MFLFRSIFHLLLILSGTNKCIIIVDMYLDIFDLYFGVSLSNKCVVKLKSLCHTYSHESTGVLFLLKLPLPVITPSYNNNNNNNNNNKIKNNNNNNNNNDLPE